MTWDIYKMSAYCYFVSTIADKWENLYSICNNSQNDIYTDTQNKSKCYKSTRLKVAEWHWSVKPRPTVVKFRSHIHVSEYNWNGFEESIFIERGGKTLFKQYQHSK